MPPVIDKQSELSLTPDDFDPPLKRVDATIPGYWTLEEISIEIGFSTRKVTYDIMGRPSIGLLPTLKAYKVAQVFLVKDEDALLYIQRYRNRKKS